MSEDAIIAVEEELRRAMLAGDVAALDRLIHDALLFTTLGGKVADKASDLDAHRTRRLRLTRMEPIERRIRIHGDAAVVTARMDAAGTLDGAAFDSTLCYTRFWQQTADGWRIIGGHMSSIKR